jgi:hypothetical protein
MGATYINIRRLTRDNFLVKSGDTAVDHMSLQRWSQQFREKSG